jgi:hypothetical protein
LEYLADEFSLAQQVETQKRLLSAIPEARRRNIKDMIKKLLLKHLHCAAQRLYFADPHLHFAIMLDVLHLAFSHFVVYCKHLVLRRSAHINQAFHDSLKADEPFGVGCRRVPRLW